MNIAELEEILSRQKYVIISLHVELEKETPSIDTLRALASELQMEMEKETPPTDALRALISEIQALNEKAVTFEFYLERRKTKRRVRVSSN